MILWSSVLPDQAPGLEVRTSSPGSILMICRSPASGCWLQGLLDYRDLALVQLEIDDLPGSVFRLVSSFSTSPLELLLLGREVAAEIVIYCKSICAGPRLSATLPVCRVCNQMADAIRLSKPKNPSSLTLTGLAFYCDVSGLLINCMKLSVVMPVYNERNTLRAGSHISCAGGAARHRTSVRGRRLRRRFTRNPRRVAG
jgi:hypothetical protein